MEEKFDKIILGEGQIFTTNMKETQQNNNILLLASSGAGKTRGIIEPSLLELNNSSGVLSDPKGYLFKKYSGYLKKKGYHVACLDIDTLKGEYSYDPIVAVDSEADVLSLAHAIVFSDPRTIVSKADPFWDQCSEILLSALIVVAIVMHEKGASYFETLLDYAQNIELTEDGRINCIMRAIEKKMGACLAVRQWNKIYALRETRNTAACIIGSLTAILGKYESEEFREFLRKPMIDFSRLTREKMVLFVKCSDSDSTYHSFCNLFFQQLIRQLFCEADANNSGRLNRPVRIILEDFASSVAIEGMGRILSTCRGRDIAFTIVCQSESQLKHMYREEANTIIGNSDSIVFMGTTDIETAKNMSIRLDVPIGDCLYMNIGDEWIFRRGSKPVLTKRYNLENHKEYPYLIQCCQKNESGRHRSRRERW